MSNRQVVSGPLALAVAAVAAGAAGGQTPPTLLSVLEDTSCVDSATDSIPSGGPYMVVSRLGSVLAFAGTMTERDSLRVYVLGPESLLRRLTVARTSGTREQGTVNVLGQTAVASSRSRPAVCRSAGWTLRHFAPGTGQIEISALWPNRKDDGIGYTAQSLAKPAFPVTRLYRGALLLGVVGTALRDPEYGLRVSPSDTGYKTIVYTARPGGRLLYALFYTHFWGSQRDIETDHCVRFDPAVGLVLNDVLNNALAGLAVHYGYSFYLIGGAHVGKVHGLDERPGLDVGDQIRTVAAAIPVDTRFRVSWFLGGGIDLRAASRLFGLLSK